MSITKVDTTATDNSQPLFIVLTGGPCAGKTTVLNYLVDRYGSAIRIVPEAATELLATGYPSLSTSRNRQAWMEEFQVLVLEKLLALEAEARKLAKDYGQRVVICDRGAVDGIAYHPRGERGILETPPAQRLGWSKLQDIYDRYDSVVCLESVAVHNPEKFSAANNATRYEAVDEAVALDYRIRQAWSNHHSFRFICNDQRSLDDICAIVTATTDRIMRSPA